MSSFNIPTILNTHTCLWVPGFGSIKRPVERPHRYNVIDDPHTRYPTGNMLMDRCLALARHAHWDEENFSGVVTEDFLWVMSMRAGLRYFVRRQRQMKINPELERMVTFALASRSGVEVTSGELLAGVIGESLLFEIERRDRTVRWSAVASISVGY